MALSSNIENSNLIPSHDNGKETTDDNDDPVVGLSFDLRNGLEFLLRLSCLHHRFLISHHLLMTRRGQNVRALKFLIAITTSSSVLSERSTERST